MFEIGATLRQAREKRRIGFDTVEAETKIRTRYLRALEDEDFEVIPGPTYVRGFLRSYAAYLELDGHLFVDEYNSRFFDPVRDETYVWRRSLPRHDRRAPGQSHAVLIALAAITAIAVLVIVAATYPRGNSAGPANQTPTPPSTQPPGNPALGTTTAPTPTLPPAATPVRLSVQAVNGACFTSIWRGHGKTGIRLFNDVLDPAAGGRAGPWTSKTGFTVEIAAEGNLALVVNGRRLSLPSGSRFFVSPRGVVTPLK